MLKKIASIIAILAIMLVVVELLANIYVYYGLGIERSDYIDYYKDNPDLGLVTWLSRYKPHPYFGYETQSVREFEQREVNRSSEFVVGIFGGSVAKSLGNHLQDHPGYFENIRPFLPNLSSKKIIIANLALGAGKQPQQFFMSAFFLDKLDLVINVDGFNDASPDHFLPVYPLEFPVTSLKYLERSTRGQIYTGIAKFVTWTYVAIHDLPASHPRFIAPSSLYFTFWSFIHPRLFKLITLLQNKIHETAIKSKKGKSGIPNDIIMNSRVDIWERYTEMQFNVVSSSSGKHAFFFVQPNQYLEGTKPLSEKEKSVAINERRAETSNQRMTGIIDGYSRLKNKEIPIFSLTDIYAETDDTVYIDSCCHVNSLGNHLMSTAIAEQLKRYYQADEAPR